VKYNDMMKHRLKLLLLLAFTSDIYAAYGPQLPTQSRTSESYSFEKTLPQTKMPAPLLSAKASEPTLTAAPSPLPTSKPKPKPIETPKNKRAPIHKITVKTPINVSPKSPTKNETVTVSIHSKNTASDSTQFHTNDTDTEDFFTTLQPQKNETIHYNNLIVSGQTTLPISKLFINGTKVSIKKNGKFSQMIHLTSEKKNQTISIWAQAATGKTSTFDIPIIYLNPSTSSNKQTIAIKNPTLEKMILNSITHSYHALGWVEIPLQYADSLQDNISSKQYKALINNHICLSKDKKMMVAFPLTNLYEPINSISDKIAASLIKESPTTAITLIWFNSEGTLWEMYYPPTHSNHAYMWILDNKEIAPTGFTTSQARRMMLFLKHPF